MSERSLPEGFKDLEPLVLTWALPTQRERWYNRMNTSMEDLKAYYDQILPRMDEIMTYLNGFPLDALPPECSRLFDLAKMFLEVSLSVELFNAPDEPGVFGPDRVEILLG